MPNYLFEKVDIPGGSGANGFVYISVVGVDAAGLAVGNVGDTDGDWHGFTVAPDQPWTQYDPPNSSNNTEVVGITDSGEIYGDYTDWSNVQHGFVVSGGVTTTIDVPFATATYIAGATASGELFGSYVYGGELVEGFIDNNGAFTTVIDPAGQSTNVSGVNASGVIVGTTTDSQFVAHAFVDNGGTFTTLNPPGSYSSSAVGVTASGEVVGTYQDTANDQYGFIYNNGAFTKISVAGSGYNIVSQVSDSGEIVGYYVDASGHVDGFIDQNGTITTVDVPGATDTEIMGINAAGEIYGDYNDSLGQHGFVGLPDPVNISVAPTAAQAAQGGPALAVLSGAPIISDTSSTTLSSATIEIANAGGNPVAGDELTINGQQGGTVDSGLVTVSWNDTTKTLTLTGTTSLADYQTLLSEIGYQDTGTDTSTGSHPVRTVTWTVDDGANTNTVTSTIEIDRSPTVVNDAATDMVGATIGATASSGVLSNDTDLDSDHLTVTGVSDTTQGAGTVGTSLAGVYGHLTLNADGSYSYIADNTAAIGSAPNGLLQDSFTYTVSDGNGGASTAVLDVAVERTPVVTTSNVSFAPGQTMAASSLFAVNDPNGYAITEYQFWDRTSDSASGHFYFNGVEVADHTVLDVTAAQLSEVTFVTGTDPTALEIRAFDGVSWSAAQSALWAPFTVNVTVPPPPIVTTSNVSFTPGQTLAASSLFTVTDPDSLAITEYQFWDRTSDPASGHFYFNGVEVADHTVLDVTAAQLSEVTFVTGTDPNGLEVRAYDGVNWSASENALWAPFTVNVTAPPAPIVTTSNVSFAPGQTLAASSLFTVSDPDSLAITEYQFWDRTSDSASGHLYFNGVEVADHTVLDVTAAQLSEVTFVTGTDPTALEVRAFDGVSWSAGENDLWAPFTVNVTAPPAPIVTTSDINSTPHQTLAASSLFTVADPDSLAITEYQFWDRTSDPASGHFYFNGVEVADHTVLDVTAAQLSEVTFVTGTDPNALEVRAFDGVSWSAADNAVWAPFNVNITTPPPPVVTTSNLTENPGQTLAASSLFAVTDPDNLAITEYQFWDRTSDPASGHFYFNGVEVADHTVLDVTAAQLSEVTFVTGTDVNALEVRAFDGVSWSASENDLWAPFNVNIPASMSLATPAVPATTPATESVTLATGPVADNFVFAPNFGQATISNFAPALDTIQIDHTMFATVSALLAATHDDASGNAVITDALHDTITIKNVTTAQLLAHQADFHFV